MRKHSLRKLFRRAKCTRSKINRRLTSIGNAARYHARFVCVRNWHKVYDLGMRVLLVEDDTRISHFVAKGLREQAYAVDVASTGEGALYQLAVNTYDIVVLDVMIPDTDGFTVCKELRQSAYPIPVPILTA